MAASFFILCATPHKSVITFPFTRDAAQVGKLCTVRLCVGDVTDANYKLGFQFDNRALRGLLGGNSLGSGREAGVFLYSV